MYVTMVYCVDFDSNNNKTIFSSEDVDKAQYF